MKKGTLGICVMLTLVLALAQPALSLSYFVYDQWGGTWHDANKNGKDDSLMCWAAAASNVLAWGKWGTSTYATAPQIFQHIKDHWTNNTSVPSYAYKWWLYGVSPAPSKYYAYADVPGGGGFYPDLYFGDYYTGINNSMANIDKALRNGQMTAVLINRGGPVGHVITVWGFDYTVTKKGTVYNGIYVTDSDDGVFGLRYYPLTYKDNFWLLGGSYTGWYIASGSGLKFNDMLKAGAVVPLPGSMLLILGPLFLLGLGFRRRGEK